MAGVEKVGTWIEDLTMLLFGWPWIVLAFVLDVAAKTGLYVPELIEEGAGKPRSTESSQ